MKDNIIRFPVEIKTRMERLSGIKFARPDAPIYRHGFIVGSSGPTKKTRSKKKDDEKE